MAVKRPATSTATSVKKKKSSSHDSFRHLSYGGVFGLPQDVEVADERATAIAREISASANKLVSLTFIECKFSDDGLSSIVDSFRKSRTIKTVMFRNMHLTKSAVTTIAQALPPNLQELYLPGNKLDDNAAEILAAAFVCCKKLQFVDLHENDIGDAGAIAISNALPKCPKLTEISLNSNKIGDLGTSALAACMSKLHYAGLRDNPWTIEGIRCISEALKTTTTLRHICLARKAVPKDWLTENWSWVKDAQTMLVSAVDSNPSEAIKSSLMQPFSSKGDLYEVTCGMTSVIRYCYERGCCARSCYKS